jgi:hypothetical protein
MQWRPFLLKEGGLIQVDICFHPPIPLAQKKKFHLGSFLKVFWVSNIWGNFLGPKRCFLGIWGQRDYLRNYFGTIENRSSQLDLSNGVSNTPNEDRMQKIRPWEVDVSTTPIGPANLLAFHLPGLGFCILLMLKRNLEPHCNNHLLANVSICHISSQR